MGWFGKEKGKVGASDESKLSASAQKIADRILNVQARWAARLNAQSQKLGVKNTKFLIGAALIGFGIYCAWLMSSAFI
jgi:hypothetical protein